MKIIIYSCSLLAISLISYATAPLTLEDFDSYTHTDDLQYTVAACGSTAQPGALILQPQAGVNHSNAVCFELPPDPGGSAGLKLINLDPVAGDLSKYSEIQFYAHIEVLGGYNESLNTTRVRVALENANGTLWQSLDSTAVDPDSGDPVALQLSSADMERVAGTDSFERTLAGVDTIELQFIHAGETGIRQTVCVDSIVVRSGFGTLIHLAAVDREHPR